jgi:Sigma-70 region 2
MRDYSHSALESSSHASASGPGAAEIKILRILKTLECVLMDMGSQRDVNASGPLEARYLAFLETLTNLRPSLHRYCSRMTGSVLDGEDLVQDALFQAYRKLATFDESLPLGPWLFRIAHNRCIDFLRRRKIRTDAEVAAVKPDRVMPVDPPGHALGRAVEHPVLALPPAKGSSGWRKKAIPRWLC